jgi:hypothetical protein
MSAPESQDPDFRVPGAWLAQASKAADELLAKEPLINAVARL